MIGLFDDHSLNRIIDTQQQREIQDTCKGLTRIWVCIKQHERFIYTYHWNYKG